MKIAIPFAEDCVVELSDVSERFAIVSVDLSPPVCLTGRWLESVQFYFRIFSAAPLRCDGGRVGSRASMVRTKAQQAP